MTTMFSFIDRDILLTTHANTTGLRKTFWWKQAEEGQSVQAIGFMSRYLNKAEKSYSVGELELLLVAWKLKNFPFYLDCQTVFLCADHQA